MADTRTFSERILSSAVRRFGRTADTLALLRRISAGDVVLLEDSVNALMRRANLDEDLPIRWETLQVRFYDGYFELEVQGSALFIETPLFRIQGRFESVQLSLNQQTVRIRLLREIQTVSKGIVQRLLTLFIHAVFGRLLEPEGLFRLLDRGHVAFTHEEPNLLRFDLHEMDHARKHLTGLVADAAAAVLGRDTVLVHAIDCNRGELVIRTTTVARELSQRAIQVGSYAQNTASRVVTQLQGLSNRIAENFQDPNEDPSDDSKTS